MTQKIIKPTKKLSGEVKMPGDKSISHRAVMLAAIAKGKTIVKNLLDCDDCNYTIHAFKEMGIDIKKRGARTIVTGRSLRGLERPKAPIYLGNSGTSMRLLPGILAGQDFESTLVGDESLSGRPMKRIVEPLSLMGVDIKASESGYPPLIIKGGKVKPITYGMPIPSAQVKSAILLAGLYSDGVTMVEEVFKSRDHTERMLRYFGANIEVKGLKTFISGGRELAQRNMEIPGDISSASFFLVGAVLLKNSEITITDVGINPTRSGILKILLRMGARIKIFNKKELFEPAGDIKAEHGSTKGIVIEESEIPSVIDELPIIFVLASLSKGRTKIRGARELRVKEADRINSMKENLQKMGARFEIKQDEIVIDGVDELKGANLKSFNDHRTCMSMAVAALAAKGESTLDDVECVKKSFPEFFEIMERLKG